MSENKIVKMRSVVVLLLAFVFGVLIAFRCHSEINVVLARNPIMLSVIFVSVLALSSLSVSSLTGVTVLPVMCAFSGICTAVYVQRTRELHSLGEQSGLIILMLAVVVPAHFVICNTGLSNSSAIRAIVSTRKKFYKDSLITSYLLMLFTAGILTLLVRHII